MHAAYPLPVTGGPLSTLAEVRAHVTAATAGARRTLAIYTQDLEPLLYDHEPFLEAIKHLVLARSHARVRVLIADPMRAIRDGNRFVAMARRLTSYIDLRNVPKDMRNNPAAFLVADNNASVYRPNSATWDGTAAMSDLASAAKHLAYFDSIWRAADSDLEYQAHLRG
jgi:hypothetical protein